MKNRVPTYPGRVKLTPVSTNIYDLERADEPTEAGTPLNKATLFSDSALAALTGAGLTITEETPSGALEQIASVIGSNLSTAKAELVSYTGTGVFGSSANATEITFSFKPDLLLFLCKDPLTGSYNDYIGNKTYNKKLAIPLDTLTSTYTGGYGACDNYGTPTKCMGKLNGNTYSFYINDTGASADKQLNNSGTKYYVLAIKGV